MKYILPTVLFGLMQIWILLMILLFKRVHYKVSELIKDGGLFIFSSTLAITSLINYLRIFKLVEQSEINYALISPFIIISICFLGFTTAVQTNISPNEPYKVATNTVQNWAQLICAVSAIGYGYVTDFRLNAALPLVTK